MSMQRLSFDFPEEEHKYLKMCCAKLGVSIKDFVTQAIIDRVDEKEDEWWFEKPETKEILRKFECGEMEMVSWEDVKQTMEIYE